MDKKAVIACKLNTPELQKRKAEVVDNLSKRITSKKELADGYAFRFPGTDEMLGNLLEFIKTERECCSFFTFQLSANGDQSEAWLSLTGPEGTKDFIITELGW